jgi:hypothetical protein
MQRVSRRKALQSLGIAALAASLGRLGSAEDAPASQQTLNGWLDRLYANAARLRDREISGLQWQEAMDGIFVRTPMQPLHQRLEFPALCRRIQSLIRDDQPEYFHRIELPGSEGSVVEGAPEPHRVLITKVAHVRKGHAVPPHGHSNMVSAFLCLSGEFEVRLYDRLEEGEEHMVVRQSTHQLAAGRGTWSSISDYRDNVHWLKAKTDDCFLFTTKMLNLEPGRSLHGRINVDLLRAASLGSDTWRAPKITAAEAREIY